MKPKERTNNTAHVILFDKGYFGGAHKHVFEDVANLNAPGDDHFNDKGKGGGRCLM